MSTPASTAPQPIPLQRATVTLIVSCDGLVRTCHALVTRISPLDIRLALLDRLDASPSDIFRWNPMVRVRLSIPQASREVATRGIITGVMENPEDFSFPYTLDLDFPEITEEEEQALRDSNPLLVVA